MSELKVPHVVIACDKFKGSLSASEACEAISAGLPPAWTRTLRPIADGGEGFAETLRHALEGETIKCKVRDPLGRIITASYAIAESGGERVAIMEMAQASGLHRVSDGRPNIMQSTTYGTGEMLKDAAGHGVDRIVIGLGGSATNDGGCGMARALGARFYDRHDKEISGSPNELKEIAHADLSDLIQLPPITVACDVDNPLTGGNGASAVFGPQKGASDSDISALDAMLDRVARILKRQDYAIKAGAGAAGGLGFGLMVFCQAKLVPGFDLVAQTLDLENLLKTADMVITGEGSLDAQTLSGKGPAGIALLARDLGIISVGIAGRVTKHVTAARLFDHTISLEDSGKPLDELIANAALLLTKETQSNSDQLARLISAGS